MVSLDFHRAQPLQQVLSYSKALLVSSWWSVWCSFAPCFPSLIDSPCFDESDDEPARNRQESLAQLGLEGFMPEELSAKLLYPLKLLNSPIEISIPTAHILGGQTDKYIA